MSSFWGSSGRPAGLFLMHLQGREGGREGVLEGQPDLVSANKKHHQLSPPSLPSLPMAQKCPRVLIHTIAMPARGKHTRVMPRKDMRSQSLVCFERLAASAPEDVLGRVGVSESGGEGGREGGREIKLGIGQKWKNKTRKKKHYAPPLPPSLPPPTYLQLSHVFPPGI